MFDIHRKELDWAGRRLVLETGRIARQAGGAVVVTYGDTMVLCTAVGEREPKPGLGFFPLTVNYQEKTFAAGKIPGGFFKREGRPSEKETLTSRLIDRPIRPLFAKGYNNETQVICTVLSHDLDNNPDIPAMIGASAGESKVIWSSRIVPVSSTRAVVTSSNCRRTASSRASKEIAFGSSRSMNWLTSWLNSATSMPSNTLLIVGPPVVLEARCASTSHILPQSRSGVQSAP